MLIGLDQFNLNARAGLSNKLHSSHQTHAHTHTQTFSKEKYPQGMYLLAYIYRTNGTDLTGHHTFLRLIFLATLFKKLDMISSFISILTLNALYPGTSLFLFFTAT